MTKPSLEDLFSQAFQLQLSGQPMQAEILYRQILSHDPNQADALHMLGTLAIQNGRLELAATLIGRALAVHPDWAEAHLNLGTVLLKRKQLKDAVESFHRALALKPGHAIALNNLGNALTELGEVDEAINNYLGALAANPSYFEAHNNLGVALRIKGRLADAVASFERCLAIQPDYAEAHNNLGNALKDQGLYDQAIAAYRRCLALQPKDAAAYRNLAIAFMFQGKHEEALEAIRSALGLYREYADAYSTLSSIYSGLGQFEDAVTADRRAVVLRHGKSARFADNQFSFLFLPNTTPQSIFEECRLWADHYAAPLAGEVTPHTNKPLPGRRLRIGYVSPDFREHCQSLFTFPLLSHHDHEQFEVFCYSHTTQPDAITARLQSCADTWRDTAGLNDSQYADLIRQDQIDILIDLTMHMRDNRLLVFARKPAPVQVTWLAYPGTTGLTAIDYRLTDPYLDPVGSPSQPGLFDAFYSEKSIRLPDTFWCYDPGTTDPAVNALPALANGYPTLACLNSFFKVNDVVVGFWARVLLAIPNARLLILCDRPAQRLHVRELLQANGIHPSRISFTPRQPRPNYLALYHSIDVCLDTFPYNGHTTGLDAYWMGVPVISPVGGTVVGRAGLSQLTNLGLTDLIAHTPEQFIQIAANLCRDLPRLAQLRATLRERMQASPLMDAPRLARAVEAAFRTLWHHWCAKPPVER